MSIAMITAGAALAAKSGEAVKSGPWGLAIILVLCVACYFLFKSMSKHLRRVREQFPTQEPQRRADGRQAQTPNERPPAPPTDPAG
jgi:hypothetical protein